MDRDALPDIVSRAAQGDEAAFARIVAAHHDDMARVAFVVCGDVELAQDAVQSAWPKAWRKLGSVRDPDLIRPWLVSIAANEARQLARSRSRRWVRETAIDPVIDGGLRDPNRSSDPANRAAELDLANALASLDSGDRVVIALRYAAGLTSDEIGQALGMTGGGARARIARVLARLRKELDDD
ncbi:MAG TPA: RNA polymerase sigma factor [Candidatus Limnocylindria bacterium]|nr:RNA polymerase sigma factor [Candidatus Limnocylindria bacterium]